MYNMKTKRRSGSRKGKTMKNGKSKKWTTAIEAAEKQLKQTGSVKKAQAVFKAQALANARKLFGYSSKQMHK
jgi:hypothetical protein